MGSPVLRIKMMPKVGPDARSVAQRAIKQQKRRLAQETKKDAKAAEKLRDEVAGHQVSEEIAEDGLTYLLQEAKAAGFASLDELAKTDWLSERIVNASVLSRKQQYEQIADAYAMFVALSRDSTLASALLVASKRRGRKPDGRTSALRLVLELYITYGDGSDHKAKKRAQNLHARDVAAVEHLINSNIKPSEVLAFSEKGGQGLDEWAFDRAGGGVVGLTSKTRVKLFDGWSNVITWRKIAPDGKSALIVYKGELTETSNDRIDALLKRSKALPFKNRFRSLEPKKSESQ